MRINKAFVVVSQSEMDHNKGKLFYKACYTDWNHVLWNVLDSSEYPFVWGFEKIEHALQIVDNYNDPHSEITCSAIARQFAHEERPNLIAINLDGSEERVA